VLALDAQPAAPGGAGDHAAGPAAAQLHGVRPRPGVRGGARRPAARDVRDPDVLLGGGGAPEYADAGPDAAASVAVAVVARADHAGVHPHRALAGDRPPGLDPAHWRVEGAGAVAVRLGTGVADPAHQRPSAARRARPRATTVCGS